MDRRGDELNRKLGAQISLDLLYHALERHLFGVVTAENASEGIVVCSGHFTKDAIGEKDLIAIGRIQE